MKFAVLIILISLVGCQGPKKDGAMRNDPSLSMPDSVIGRQPMIEKIAGSVYLKRATGYFMIVGIDTVDYMPIFTEAKNNGKVALDLNISYTRNDITHRQRMDILKKILPIAARDYNFDSLMGISVGRLIQTGDLAIQVTTEYWEKFEGPTTIRITDYQNISEFLLESKLATGFNELLNPYSLTVNKIGIEKAFFATRDELLTLATIEADTSIIPTQILDCITDISLRKI